MRKSEFSPKNTKKYLKKTRFSRPTRKESKKTKQNLVFSDIKATTHYAKFNYSSLASVASSAVT